MDFLDVTFCVELLESLYGSHQSSYSAWANALSCYPKKKKKDN